MCYSMSALWNARDLNNILVILSSDINTEKSTYYIWAMEILVISFKVLGITMRVQFQTSNFLCKNWVVSATFLHFLCWILRPDSVHSKLSSAAEGLRNFTLGKCALDIFVNLHNMGSLGESYWLRCREHSLSYSWIQKSNLKYLQTFELYLTIKIRKFQLISGFNINS